MIPYFHVTEHFFFFSYKVGSEESCRRDEEFPGWETEGGGILRKKMGGGVGRVGEGDNQKSVDCPGSL